MKFTKIKLLAITLITSSGIYAQVGIGKAGVSFTGANAPKAALEVRASSETAPTATDAFLVPRVTALPTTTGVEEGAMIFKRGDGFYYFDATTSSWLRVVTQVSRTNVAFNSLVDNSISAGAFRAFPFDNKKTDATSAYNTSTKNFTAPSAGQYQFSVNAAITSMLAFDSFTIRVVNITTGSTVLSTITIPVQISGSVYQLNDVIPMVKANVYQVQYQVTDNSGATDAVLTKASNVIISQLD